MKKKLIVRIAEGLGNQLFMYANAYAISKKYDCELLIDNKSAYFKPKNKSRNRKFLLDSFNIDCKFADTKYLFNSYLKDIKRKFLKKLDLVRKNKFFLMEKKYFNKNTAFLNINDISKFNNPFYIEGHFESELYFQNFHTNLNKIFSLKKNVVDFKNKYIDQINNTNSISIHIRNHRYSESLYEKKNYQNRQKSILFTNESINYAKRGMDYFIKTMHDPTFFIWSNDFLNLSDEFKGYKCIFVNNNNDTLVDFFLFSYCKHFIVSPSTYHWWGAWLNNNPDKICLRPKNMNPSNNKDFWPTNWIPI